ncbi:MAG: hypothetical protein K2K66_02020 [Ruminococcus sp.]|nr:hypothetical protein [Ruminococcus sp.]MDE6538942.1 hypothetical protein [Ruminococcus sp.]
MFEQDYIMRQIQQILKVLVKVLFNVDDQSPSLALIQNVEVKETAGDLLRKIDDGNINEAENELSKMTDTTTKDNLLAGIIFYSYLNEKDDDYLESHDFSREEVEDGIKNLLSKYGLQDMSDIFFYY